MLWIQRGGSSILHDSAGVSTHVIAMPSPLTGWQPGDQHAIDPVAVHVNDLEPMARSLEDVASPWYATERQHHQPAKRVIVLAVFIRQQRLDIEGAGYGIEIQSAIHQPAPILAAHNRGVLARL